MIAKVGITGAGGLIGIDLTEGLAEKYQLTLFYHNTKPTTARKLPVVQADLSDEKQVKGIFEGLDAVIHLAAASSSLSSWENVLTQNIITTYNVFEEVRRARCCQSSLRKHKSYPTCVHNENKHIGRRFNLCKETRTD